MQFWAFPPMLETAADLEGHIRMATALKAIDGGRLVGAVRGVVTGPSCLIRALVVAPHLQGQGLGGRLLRALEDAHPTVERFDLLTNTVMEGNVRFYLRHGYEVVEKVQPRPGVWLAMMRKFRTLPPSA
jgi:GNAT superfamily N-acetyltransferase